MVVVKWNNNGINSRGERNEMFQAFPEKHFGCFLWEQTKLSVWIEIFHKKNELIESESSESARVALTK